MPFPVRTFHPDIPTWQNLGHFYLALTVSRTHRKPILVVELSGVFDVRAATRYRLQYDSWQRYDPPFITRVLPDEGPAGFFRDPTKWYDG